MKRWLIEVGTNWCGEDNTFSAYADNELELADIIDQKAYENFNDYSGLIGILEELFPDVEEYTEEMEIEASRVEHEYYYGNCEEWDESRPEEEWDWYDCVYDGRVVSRELAEDEYNNLDNLSRT